MDLGLKGKRVLVTGGTKSIGRAIVDASSPKAPLSASARAMPSS
jgi:FlaA1/EpsC-like NDP-sugar epimerase